MNNNEEEVLEVTDDYILISEYENMISIIHTDEILHAVRQGNTKQLRYMIDLFKKASISVDGPTLGYVNSYDSALRLAVFLNNIEAVDILIKEGGADVYQHHHNQFNYTPLCLALYHGHLILANHILDYMINDCGVIGGGGGGAITTTATEALLCISKDDYSIVMVAVEHNYHEILKRILTYLSNRASDMINHQCSKRLKKTALHMAAEFGYIESAEILLEHGCDRHIKDSVGLSAASVARTHGYTNIAALIECYEPNIIKHARDHSIK